MDVPSSSVYNINYCKMCDALWRVLSYPPSPPSSRNGDVCSPEEVSSQYTSTPLDLCWPPTAPPWYKSYHPPLLGGVDCSENEIKRCHSCCAFYLIHASLLPFQTKHPYLCMVKVSIFESSKNTTPSQNNILRSFNHMPITYIYRVTLKNVT